MRRPVAARSVVLGQFGLSCWRLAVCMPAGRHAQDAAGSRCAERFTEGVAALKDGRLDAAEAATSATSSVPAAIGPSSTTISAWSCSGAARHADALAEFRSRRGRTRPSDRPGCSPARACSRWIGRRGAIADLDRAPTLMPARDRAAPATRRCRASAPATYAGVVAACAHIVALRARATRNPPTGSGKRLSPASRSGRTSRCMAVRSGARRASAGTRARIPPAGAARPRAGGLRGGRAARIRRLPEVHLALARIHARRGTMDPAPRARSSANWRIAAAERARRSRARRPGSGLHGSPAERSGDGACGLLDAILPSTCVGADGRSARRSASAQAPPPRSRPRAPRRISSSRRRRAGPPPRQRAGSRHRRRCATGTRRSVCSSRAIERSAAIARTC